MSDLEQDLQLLLVHADRQDPYLPEGLHADESEPPADDARRPPDGPVYLSDAGTDPNSLPDQYWGLIVPEGQRGDRLQGLLGELVKARGAEQADRVQVFRVPQVMDQNQAADWQRKVLDTCEDLGVKKPRYLLLAGDLDEVPLGLQQVLSASSFVGRLAFDADQDYERYADKLLGFERAPATASKPRALFHTVHDGSAATRVGHKSLMEPGLSLACETKGGGPFPAHEIRSLGSEQEPSPDDLLSQVGSQHPSVLLSVSHGLGAPRAGWASPDEQRRLQGAMSFGNGQSLSGSDLRETPFLPGGMWFMLACFGAGTPDASAYYGWLSRLKDAGKFRGPLQALLAGLPEAGQRPFIADLPKAVLANPKGPLSMIGHIDLAWSYAFQELDHGKPIDRPGRYLGVLAQQCRGRRAGIAFDELYRSFSQVSLQIAAQSDQHVGRDGPRKQVVDAAQQAHLWMLRQDLAGYVLLGDPAARLPLAGMGAGRAIVAPANQASAVSVQAVGVQPSVERPPIDAQRLEEAIAAVIVGEQGTRALARELGVERTTLDAWVQAYRRAGRTALGYPT